MLIEEYIFLEESRPAIHQIIQEFDACVEQDITPKKLLAKLETLKSLTNRLPDTVVGVSISATIQTLNAFETDARMRLTILQSAYALAEEIAARVRPMDEQYLMQLRDMYEEELRALPEHMRAQYELEDVQYITDRGVIGDAIQEMVINNPDYYNFSEFHRERLGKIYVLVRDPVLYLDSVNFLELAIFFAIDLFTPFGEILAVTQALLEGDFEGAVHELMWAALPFDDVVRVTSRYIERSREIVQKFRRISPNDPRAISFEAQLMDLLDRMFGSNGLQPAYAGASNRSSTGFRDYLYFSRGRSSRSTATRFRVGSPEHKDALRAVILAEGYTDEYFELWYDFEYVNKLAAGTAEHKAKRWEMYVAGGGEWDEVHWSNVYESNVIKARQAHERVVAYHQTLEWGTINQTLIDTPQGGRYLDIIDTEKFRGIEYKTGYVYQDPFVKLEADKDAFLISSEERWQIEWVIEDRISEPMKKYLEKRGIKVTILNSAVIVKE